MLKAVGVVAGVSSNYPHSGGVGSRIGRGRSRRALGGKVGPCVAEVKREGWMTAQDSPLGEDVDGVQDWNAGGS